MKVVRVELFFVDFDGISNGGEQNIIDTIECARYPNRCVAPSVLKVETRDIGEWSEDNPLNRHHTHAAEIKRLFGE